MFHHPVRCPALCLAAAPLSMYPLLLQPPLARCDCIVQPCSRLNTSGQASTRVPADTDLQGTSFLDTALVNGKRVDFHLVDLAGSIGADVMIVDPIAPSYVEPGLDEASLFSGCIDTKRNQHVLNGATMFPLVVTTFGKLGPVAQGFLQSLPDVACSTGVVDHGSWLRISQYLICLLVRGRGFVFRYYYQSVAKSAGKDFRDGAAVPFE